MTLSFSSSRLPALCLVAGVLLSTACRPDDVDDTGSNGGSADGGSSDGGSGDGGSSDGGSGDGGSDGGSGDGGSGGDCAGLGLLGDWLSEGDDISPLFQHPSVDYVRVEASFTASCDYTAYALTGDGSEYDFSGTYTATAGSPGSIVQTQAQPFEGVSDGIWQVDGDVLTFEVVLQGYGFTAPTPETGFGSTSGQGLSEGDNVQIYRKQ